MDTVVETDPSGRFARSGKVLGQGASKTVYKAFDRIEGREVAWNKALVHGSTETAHSLLHTEVKVLKSLKHRNIMKFYASWVDEDHGTINFITEYFHSGTLKRHRIAHKSFDLQLNPALLKRWAWQILQGLVYLHGHNPPVIHRDLKCDNIFIHGVTGEVKIGDLGLARMMENNMSMCHTCIGTPEFMAPEMYNEEYNEKIDIYSFGMLLLELVTMDYPYSECKTACQIYRNVTEGVPPQALQKIEDQETRDFIEMCIRYDHKTRPSARQLVKHRFFDSVRAPSPKPFCVPSSPELALDECSLIIDGIQDSLVGVRSVPESFRPCMISDDAVDKELRDEMLARPGSAFGDEVSDVDSARQGEHLPYNKASSVGSNTDSETSVLKRQFSLQHKGTAALPFVDVINFELCFGGPGATKKLMFSFDVLSDTVEDVGLELEEEYSLTPEETELFTHLLKQELERALQSAPLRSHGDSKGSAMNTFNSLMVSMSLDDWTNNRSRNGLVKASLSGDVKSGSESGVESGVKSGAKSGVVSGIRPSSKAPPLVSFKINMEGNGNRRTSRYDAVARRRRSIEGDRGRSSDHRGPRKSFNFERADVWNNLVHHLKGGPTSISKHSVSRYKRCSDTRVASDDSAMLKKGSDQRRDRDVEQADRRQKQKGDKGNKGDKGFKRRNSLGLSNVSITPVLNQVRMVAGAVKHIKSAAVILCRNSLEGKKIFFEIRGKGAKQAKDAVGSTRDERTRCKGSAQFDSRRSMSEPSDAMPERVSVDMDGCLGCMSPVDPSTNHKKSVFGSFRRVASKVWSSRKAEAGRL
eukprot:evm.model.scf_236.5 EVM.evm.TU.scf_236.5   scf_236:81892-88375(+)